MTVLTIPYPPSTNRLWRAVNGRNIKSDEYRKWLTEAGWHVNLQRPVKITGAYTMRLEAQRPDLRRRDLGNLEKPVSDLLVACGVVSDDCDAQRITLEWAGPNAVVGANVTVTLEAA